MYRMSARKLHGSWWVDFRFNHQRIRKRSPINSSAGTLQYEATLRQRLARGEPILASRLQAPSLPTFSEFARHWYDTYVVANNRPSEQKNKRSALNLHLLPWLGKKRIDAISGLHIEEFKAAKLESGLSPKTINNLLAILKRCLRDASDWLKIDSAPKIKLLKVPPQKFDYLTFDESRRLLAACADSFWRTMILVALNTGLRLGELKGLQWTDISFEHGHLTVRRSVVGSRVGAPKNNKERQVPLTASVRAALLDLERRGQYVFARRSEGPINHKAPERVLGKICARSDLREIGWHTLRHTFASHLAMRGVPLRAIQELLGHSHVTTTMRYAHLAPSVLREAVAVLDTVPQPTIGTFGQPVVNTGMAAMVTNQKRPDVRGESGQMSGWGSRI